SDEREQKNEANGESNPQLLLLWNQDFVAFLRSIMPFVYRGVETPPNAALSGVAKAARLLRFAKGVTLLTGPSAAHCYASLRRDRSKFIYLRRIRRSRNRPAAAFLVRHRVCKHLLWKGTATNRSRLPPVQLRLLRRSVLLGSTSCVYASSLRLSRKSSLQAAPCRPHSNVGSK